MHMKNLNEALICILYYHICNILVSPAGIDTKLYILSLHHLSINWTVLYCIII